MSLASHAGKSTFAINGKTVNKRSGTDNIYDITGGGSSVGSGGGMGVHYGVALLNNSNLINIWQTTMDQLWNDTSQANQDAVLATDPVDPARTYLFGGANISTEARFSVGGTAGANNVEDTYKQTYVELQPTPVVAGDVVFASYNIAPRVGVGKIATGNATFSSGDFAYAVIYRDRLMVVGRSCIMANNWQPIVNGIGYDIQFKWLVV